MTSNHMRNTGPMLASERCGAKTRSGKTCMSPAVSGKSRCRMHGGAAGSGAPRGNKNALKHGRFTPRSHRAERRLVRSLLQEHASTISRSDSRPSGRRPISLAAALRPRPFFTLLLPCTARLAESDALTDPVLVEEFDAGQLKRLL